MAGHDFCDRELDNGDPPYGVRSAVLDFCDENNLKWSLAREPRGGIHNCWAIVKTIVKKKTPWTCVQRARVRGKVVEVAGVEPACWVLSVAHVYKFSQCFLKFRYWLPTPCFNYLQFVIQGNFYLFCRWWPLPHRICVQRAEVADLSCKGEPTGLTKTATLCSETILEANGPAYTILFAMYSVALFNEAQCVFDLRCTNPTSVESSTPP